ncbi:MAG: radical SAM protein [Methanomicrobiales archaeon]|nr:radical SAM protein [Methanomicrobiales archaeon]
MYFRLNPECYLILGEHSSVIYDLIEGDVHSLNEYETQLIRNCENNVELTTNEPLLDEMKERCIGNYYTTKVFIEKLRLGSPILDYQPGQPPFIEKAFLEINNTCKLSCGFCGSRHIRRSSGCLGCNTWQEEGTPLEEEQWKEVIDGLSDLHCDSVYFTGGDLTLKWELLQQLLEYAQKKFSQTFVSINSRRFSAEVADYLEGKALPIIQVDNPAHIGTDHQFLLVTDEREEFLKQIRSSKNLTIDRLVRDASELSPDSRLISKSKIQKTNLFRFTHMKKKHPCLANSLTVSWRGEVLPCPMLRRYSLGSVKEQPLYELLRKNSEGFDKFWGMCLEKIPRCTACEFRYACNDCRALEESLTGDLNGKALCRYDVSNGIWV